MIRRNPNLNHLVEPSFQGINRLFDLAFENDAQRISNERYYLPNLEIKDYNFTIDGKNFFDQPVKNNKGTSGNIRIKCYWSRRWLYNWFLLDYIYLKIYYKLNVVDLRKQQALDADTKAIQQINFTSNLDTARNTRIYFILEETKETVLDFSQGTLNVSWVPFSWVQLCWIIWFLSI